MEDTSNANTNNLTYMVLDTSFFINIKPLELTADNEYICTSYIINEIKDKKAKEYYDLKKSFIKILNPSKESMKFVSEYSMETNNLSMLSIADLSVVALAYETICKIGKKNLLNLVPKKFKITNLNKIKIKKVNKNQNKPEDANKEQKNNEEGNNDNDTNKDNNDNNKDNDINNDNENNKDNEDNINDYVVDIPPPTQSKKKTKGKRMKKKFKFLDENSSENEEEINNKEEKNINNNKNNEDNTNKNIENTDENDWITPDNLNNKIDDMSGIDKIEECIDNIEEKKENMINVLVHSSDFALQSLCLRLGIPVVGVSGKRIERVNYYLLKCLVCDNFTFDTSKKFCWHCSYSSFMKLRYNIKFNGDIEIFDKEPDVRKRGTVFDEKRDYSGKKGVVELMSENDLKKAKLTKSVDIEKILQKYGELKELDKPAKDLLHGNKGKGKIYIIDKPKINPNIPKKRYNKKKNKN